MRHVLPKPLLGLLHALRERPFGAEIEVDQRNGGEITDDSVDVRVEGTPIEVRQVEGEGRMAAPALQRRGKQGQQRRGGCDACLLPALFQGAPCLRCKARLVGDETRRVRWCIDRRQRWGGRKHRQEVLPVFPRIVPNGRVAMGLLGHYVVAKSDGGRR